jgi:hypothetical protein
MLRVDSSARILAEEILTVETIEDIEAIIASLPDASWVPLGNNPQNFPIVNISSDPADALVERVTNGIDARVERAAVQQGVTGLHSPRQAAERLFGIPAGRLANLTDTIAQRSLAENLVVTMRESGVRRSPTFVVEDRGIGQHPDDFPLTLLSLNRSNKVTRFELMGAFGQGGASVFAFASYAIIVSRRDPQCRTVDQSDLVGWSIVRYNALDDDHKHGVYEYLVVPDGIGGVHVPRFDPADLPDSHTDFVGCHFTAVQYPLDRYSDLAFVPAGSLYALLNTVLWDPTHPILIRDERPRAHKSESNHRTALRGIVVNGNATRLEQDKRDKIEYANTRIIKLGEYGDAIIRYFAVKEKGDSKADWELMENYIPREQAVTITRNGQRQGSIRREIFNKIGLISIGKMLIAQVDCDGLSKHAKKELFSTTRDRTKLSDVYDRLQQAVSQAIASDEVLRALDRERKAKALARQSESESKRINDWLKKAITSLRQGLTQKVKKIISTDTSYELLGNQPLIDEVIAMPPGSNDLVKAALSDAPTEPTMLQVLNPTVKVPVGGTGVVRIAMDARDDYVSPDPGVGMGDFSATFTKGGDLFQLTSYSAVRRGIISATISAERGVPDGETGRVVFLVTRPDALPLLAEADILTVPRPEPRAKPVGKSQGPEPGPNVEPLDMESWQEFGWSADSVTRVEEDNTTGTTTIYVLKDYPPLLNRFSKLRSDEENLVAYQSKFVAAMALAAWLQDHEQKGAEEPMSQEVRDAEVRRAAEVFLFTQFVATD